MTAIPESFIRGLPSGVDSQSLILALREAPPVSIRFNPRKNTSKALGHGVPWEANAIYLDQRPVFTLDPHFHAGAYYVQEAGSMIIGHLIKALGLDKKPIKALDLCAAPGGKTTHLASTLHPKSLIVANEYDRKRAPILKDNLERWGDSRHVICSADGNFWSQFESQFDLIVLDAPCSGEGMFRKDEFAKEQWSEALVHQCSSVQKSLLKSAWKALAPDGILLYSTCTFNLQENEGQLTEFIKKQSVKKINSLSLNSEWGIEKKQHVFGETLRFFPHLLQSEGFTISVLGKKEGSGSSAIKAGNLQGCSRKEWELIEPFLGGVNKHEVIKDAHGRFYVQQAQFMDLLSKIASYKAFLSPGLEIGSLKGKDFIPAHGLAMSGFSSASVPRVELDLCQALRYLKGEAPNIQSDKKGWAIMTFGTAELGWAKLLPNRLNNYYPKHSRIRMAIPEELCK